MPQDNLSFEEIERINIVAMERIAQDVASLEAGLVVPEKDLKLFFGMSAVTGTKMLDVGCGWGHYTSRFTAASMEYIGTDYSEPMVNHARANNPGMHFEVMNFHQMSFGDNSFDCIWACCVFGGEPKARLPEALQELRRVMRPDGVMLVIMPNLCDSVESLIEDHPVFGAFYASVWYFEEFQQSLVEAGFTVLKAIERHESGSMTFLVRK